MRQYENFTELFCSGKPENGQTKGEEYPLINLSFTIDLFHGLSCSFVCMHSNLPSQPCLQVLKSKEYIIQNEAGWANLNADKTKIINLEKGQLDSDIALSSVSRSYLCPTCEQLIRCFLNNGDFMQTTSVLKKTIFICFFILTN